MRNEDRLISDLFRLSSFQWNGDLADEFNIELGALILALNDYHYSQPSEKTIHESLLKQKQPSYSAESFQDNRTNEVQKISNPHEVGKIVAQVRRPISNVSSDYGKSFRSYMFFGFDFSAIDLPGTVMDGCIFSNCTFVDCIMPSAYIASGKFAECQFNRCDFGDSNFSKVGFFGVTFIDCNLEGCNFFDCVQHIVSYYSCEMDGINFTSGSLHKVEIESLIHF